MNYTRTQYLNGEVDHQTYYLGIVDVIGREAIEATVKGITSVAEIRACLKTDEHLNNIPLRKWDAHDWNVRRLVARNADAVMALTWPDASARKSGSLYWSLSETVCVLKAAARRMAADGGRDALCI